MTIRVEIEGKGQVAEFPDGTDQAVIDAAIKRDFFGGATPAPPTAAPAQPGLSDALSKRGSNIANEWKGFSAGDIMTPFSGVEGRVLRSAGQVAGGVNDAIGAGIKGAYGLLPEDVRGFIGERTNAVVGGLEGTPAIREGATSMADLYAAAKERYPQQTANAEAMLNIGSLVAGGRGVGKAVTPTQSLGTIEQAIDKAIDYGIKKGIRPSYAGKSDAKLAGNFFQNAKIAVRDIADNAATPISQSEDVLGAFSSAVRDTKLKLWQQAEQISKQAGDAGVLMDYQPVLNKIESIMVDATINAGDPSIKAALAPYKAAWESLIKTNGRLASPVEGEKILTVLNNKTRDFWRDPNMASAAAKIEEIAGEVRNQIDVALGDLKGEAYKDFRRRYGAQVAIEKEVTNRATQYGRKPEAGLFDIGNLSIARDLVKGATGDPIALTQAAATMIAKKALKAQNDSANIVRKMFKDVETFNAIKRRYARP